MSKKTGSKRGRPSKDKKQTFKEFKGDKGATRKFNEALEKRQEEQNKQANIKDDDIQAGIGFKGQDVDRTVKKEDEKYNDPRKHKLRNQFDYLADKYYGGSKEDFAKTSQGQVLLGYLQNVDARRGGGRGGDMVVYDKIKEAYDAGEISEEDYKKINQAVGGNTEAIRNLPIDVLRNQPELNRTGIFSSPEYFRFNQLLQSQSPSAYNTARPFSSGALPKTIFDLLTRPVTTIGSGIMDSLDNLGVINRTEKYEPMGLGSYDFLPQSLFENLPTQTTTDQGGMNDVAQFMIDNQTPVDDEEEGEFNTAQFDPDSFIAGFGFPFVDPSLFNVDGTGITGLQT